MVVMMGERTYRRTVVLSVLATILLLVRIPQYFGDQTSTIPNPNSAIGIEIKVITDAVAVGVVVTEGTAMASTNILQPTSESLEAVVNGVSNVREHADEDNNNQQTVEDVNTLAGAIGDLETDMSSNKNWDSDEFEVSVEQTLQTLAEANDISPVIILQQSKIVPMGTILLDRFKDAHLRNTTADDREALDALYDEIEKVLPTDVAQRREFGDLVTYQRALKLSGGRVEVETLLQPALSVEYTVEATFQPSASYSDACSSAVSGFTETIHISIQERIPDLTLNVSPGGTKFLVQMLTMFDNTTTIMQDCRVYDGDDGHYSAECVLVQDAHILSRSVSVEVLYPLYLGYHNYFLVGTMFNVGNNVPLREVLVEQSITLPTYPATEMVCADKHLDECDSDWLRRWNGSALIQSSAGKRMTQYIPIPQCKYNNVIDTLSTDLGAFYSRYEKVRVFGASHTKHFADISNYVTHRQRAIHADYKYIRFHYLETLIYALEMALDPSVSIDEAPFVSREVYEWKRGPMIQRQDFDNKTLCIIQVGAHDLAFRSMLATFEYMTKALGLIHAMAINFPHSTFVVQSTASYGIPKSRGIHTIRYKAEGSRHFRKETNTGALSQYMNLHVRAMALPNVHFNDYQSITVAYKYDGEWAGNHFGQVWDKLQRHPEYTPEFPLLVGQAPLEAYTVLVQGVPDAR